MTSTTAKRRPGPSGAGGLLAALIEDRALIAVLQPIVELSTGVTVGHEALARGPAGHPLATPDALFAASRSAGLLTELDAACVQAALAAAHRNSVVDPWTLFLNHEPDSETARVLPATAPAGPRVVVELTERALTADPAGVLATVDRVRAMGWGVALDDVGVNPASLALLPLLRPDVVKLDASLVQRAPDAHTAAVFSAVSAEAERSGATILAEGLETAEHVDRALALGASLGQGWYFGKPAATPAPAAQVPTPESRVRLAAGEHPASGTPFAIAAAARPVRETTVALLTAMSRHLELQAMAVGESCLVLSTFQRAEAFAPVAGRYGQLGEVAAFVAVLGVDMGTEPVKGVRGVHLPTSDPLAPEWDVVVLGPHFSALIAARPVSGSPQLTPTVELGHERYDYVISHDRNLTVAAARALMSRVTPL